MSNMFLIEISEGFRIFRHVLKLKLDGPKKYKGNAEEICKQIIDDCWNGYYFQTSSGHFLQFYARDFGICVDSLIRLGYKKEVNKTLAYALKCYSKHSKVTTAITPKGKPYDFPYYAPDSLAFLVRSLRISGASELIKRHRNFLNKEIAKFYNIVIDRNTGLVKKGRFFSSMQDFSKRKSSCYDNIMVAMLNEELKKIKLLDNPLKQYDFKKIIKENFWAGEYFLNDLESDYVAGDANIFPFWSGIFDEKEMLKKSITAIQENELDKPFPLKYAKKGSKQKMIWLEFLAPGWERNAIWTQLGALYIQLVKKIDKSKAAEHIKKYSQVIENNKTYFEVFAPNGKPYKSLFYHADEGMLWAAILLGLMKKFK